MPVYATTTALRRDELVPRVVQGANANRQNIWQQVMPPFGVNARTAHYITATIANTQALRILTDRYLTAPGSEVERMVATFGDASMNVAIRKIELKLPRENQLDFASQFSVEGRFARQLGQMADLTNEYLVATAIFNTTNFGAAAAQPTNYITAIITAIQAVAAKGEVADTVIIGATSWATVSQDAETIAFVSGADAPGAQITPTRLATALAEYGITQVLIGNAVYNSAADGVTPILTKIWDTYIWVGARGQVILDDGDEDIAGAGVSAWWEDYTPEQGYLVETYPEEKAESIIIRLKTSLTPIVVNTNAGTLITV